MIGPCAYLTCDSKIGSSFRSTFYRQAGGFDWDREGRHLDMVDGKGGCVLLEVLLCPTHVRIFETVRAKDGPSQFMVTPEGHVYLRTWLDAWGFLT